MGFANTSKSTIAVVVNNEVITVGDIEKRAALILLSSGKETSNITAELRAQVQEALVQERLQRQIAKRINIEVSQADVNAALSNIAAENKMNLEQMKEYFLSKGVPLTTLAERLKSNLLWMKTVRLAFMSQVKISDRDVEEEMQKIHAMEAKEQLHLAELVIFVSNPREQASAKKEIESHYENLQTGTPFSALARNFSQSPTSAQGGSIGWIAKDNAPAAAQNLKVSEYTKPVLSGNRLTIYYCIDKKVPGQAAESETKMSFATAKFTLPEDAQEAPENVNAFMEMAQSFHGCPAFKTAATEHGATVSEQNDVPVNGVHEELKKLLTTAGIGKVAQPVRISSTELMVMMWCDQTKPGKHQLPSHNEVKMMLLERKVQAQAIAQFNKIKTTAVIEHRIAR